MLALKKSDAVPFAGDLQFAVDSLREVLSTLDLAELDAPVERALTARRTAVEARGDAERTHADVAKRHAQDISMVRRAESDLRRAESSLEAARAAECKARETRDEIFRQRVMGRIETAVPTLIEVIRLANQAMAPLLGLYGFAASRNASMPRLLMVTPAAAESLRALTAAINFATMPNEGQATASGTPSVTAEGPR